MAQSQQSDQRSNDVAGNYKAYFANRYSGSGEVFSDAPQTAQQSCPEPFWVKSAPEGPHIEPLLANYYVSKDPQLDEVLRPLWDKLGLKSQGPPASLWLRMV
jgi:hypothetical protein